MRNGWRELWAVLLTTPGLAGATVGAPPREEAAARPQLLAASAFRSDASWRQASLWRFDIRPTQADELAYLAKDPKRGGIPRLALAVVDSPLGLPADGPPGESRVVAIVYRAAHPADPTVKHLIEFLWHPQRRTALVLVARSVPLNLKVDVYETTARRKIAAHPLVLDPKEVEKWPPGLPPAASLHARWHAAPVQVQSLSAAADGDGLLIRAAGDGKEPALYYRLDLSAKTWTQVRLETTPLGHNR